MKSARLFLGALLAVLLGACIDDGINHHPLDAGTIVGLDGGAGTSSLAGWTRPFTPPPADPGSGALLLTISGESLALSGSSFPPSSADSTFFVDGWRLTFERILVVVDQVTLWDAPDLVPTDPTQHGAVVAHLSGPWVVDLHRGGPLPGKGGGGEQALPFAAIRARDDGRAFDETLTYGFGYRTVAASTAAIAVNLDDRDLADFRLMIARGYSVLYSGTATFEGTTCGQLGLVGTSTYPFALLPTPIPFRLGFDTPTEYVNCQNGTDLAGPGVNGEAHPRGVQLSAQGSATAQLTLHVDHPFWESFAEDSPLHFDEIAARYAGLPLPEAATEDLRGVAFTAFTDRHGVPLPWRTCVPLAYYQAPGSGQLHFDSLTVPVDPRASDPRSALRDAYDYLRFTQSSQGHLNSQGLCLVVRDYAAPPGGS